MLVRAKNFCKTYYRYLFAIFILAASSLFFLNSLQLDTVAALSNAECGNDGSSCSLSFSSTSPSRSKLDLDGDGRADLCVRGAGGLMCWLSKPSGWVALPTLTVLSDAGGWTSPNGYETIDYADINGDGKTDVCARGSAGLYCWVLGSNGWTDWYGISTLSDAAGWYKPEYYQTLRFADINGDGRSDVCIRGAGGLMCWLSTPSGWVPTNGISTLSDAGGWNNPVGYQSLRFADINGDGRADVCARGSAGLHCWLSMNGNWVPFPILTTMSDAMGWYRPEYYRTIQFADLNGDGRMDVCGRGGPGLECWLSTTEGWVPTAGISVLSDAGGWNQVTGYESIQLADINGDGKADVCGRGAFGLECWTSTGSGWAPAAGVSEISDRNGWNNKTYYQTLGLGPGPRKNWESYPMSTVTQWSLASYYPATGLPISAIDWSALTHLIHCCAAFNSDGSVNMNVGWGNLEGDYSQLIASAHRKNVKVLLLLWVNDQVPTAGTSGLNLMNAIHREGPDRQAQRIVEALDRYGYDGLDLDWEWSKSVEDPPTRDAIVSLLAALRTRLGNRLITTDAFPSQASLWVQSGAFKYVDRLNVMVYDLVTCCATTWFNGAISGQASFQWALQQYQAAGAPIGKINLGIPFYGWQFADGSTGPNQPRNPSADPAKRWQISYAAIANQYFQSPNISYFDSSARASWIRTTDGWITYDNEQSVAEKIRIIRESGVGGSSVWELSHDYFPDRSPQHPLLEAVKKSWPGINGSSVGP